MIDQLMESVLLGRNSAAPLFFLGWLGHHPQICTVLELSLLVQRPSKLGFWVMAMANILTDYEMVNE